jgi:hypothetical protein
MAMGTRKQLEKQEGLWIVHTELASAPGHPFYQKLNELLEAEGFDEFVESRCANFYAAQFGRLKRPDQGAWMHRPQRASFNDSSREWSATQIDLEIQLFRWVQLALAGAEIVT